MNHGQNYELAHLRTEREKGLMQTETPQRRACSSGTQSLTSYRAAHLGHLISTYRSDQALDLGHVTAEGRDPSTCYPVPGVRSTPREEPSGQAMVGCSATTLQQPSERALMPQGRGISAVPLWHCPCLTLVVRRQEEPSRQVLRHLLGYQACQRLRPCITV